MTIPATAAGVEPFAAALAGEGCERFAARQITDTEAYSVTLCDLTQKAYDFVVVDGRVIAIDGDAGAIYYLVISAATIIVVTSVAQNIASLLGETGVHSSPRLETAAVLVLVFASPFRLTLVTTGDLVYYIYACVYVLLTAVYWACRRRWQLGKAAIPVNMLLGALLLTLCRLYNGIECEYVAPVLFLLLTRCFDRAQRMTPPPPPGDYAPLPPDHAAPGPRPPDPGPPDPGPPTPPPDPGPPWWLCLFRRATLLLDFGLAGLTHQYGFRALFSRGHEADAFLCVMALFAYTLSVLMNRGGPAAPHRI